MKTEVLILMVGFLLFALVDVMAGDFTSNNDGTVTDNVTGLMWQQGEGGDMPWENAINYCESLTLAEHNDWRLPNIKELESIVDDTLRSPAIDTKYFPDVIISYYWSSTTDKNNSYEAWYVHFSDGFFNATYNKSISLNIRCARGGQ